MSQFHTQPVRSRDLLEELREAYDDIDNSASKRPVLPPEDDPLISWDKQSLPKGLDWMNPTPSKLKSSNTIPETVSFAHRDVNHSKPGLLAANESQNLFSDVHSDAPNVPSVQEVKSDIKLGVPVPSSRVEPLNELNKENVFTPFKLTKQHIDSSVPLEMGLFSSSKKCPPSEIRPKSKMATLNYVSSRDTVEKEVLFTPLKRGNAVLTSAPTELFHTPAAKKIPSAPVIGDHVPLIEKTSLPEELNLQSDLKKSPAFMTVQPSASLLTPAKPLSQCQTPAKALDQCQTPASAVITNPSNGTLPFSVSKIPPLNSVSLENYCSSRADLVNTWKVPAKINIQADSHHEFKPGPSKHLSNYEDKKMLAEESHFKSKGNNGASDILPVKSNELASLEKKGLSSLLNSAPKAPLNSCSIQSRTLRQPTMPDPVAVPKGLTEMPPPSQEAPKPPVKESKEPQNNFVNPRVGFNALEKRNTNDQIFVNGKSYTVLSLLGRGGSSVVYLVLEPASSKLLAVKCVNLSELDQSTYEGYLNEISLLSQLQDSDCVIRMFDHQHCEEEKLLYVVMEKGDTDLSKLIRDVSRTKKVSPAMTVYYWTEMLNAVSFIHKRGTIHSDLKPANFLLVSGRLKLIDFGIASSIQGDMTSVVKDSMTGTYNYISPEALCSTGSGPDGRSMRFKISYKSDVWSLGCILYNLVYGHTPFQTISNQFMKMTAIANPNHKIPFPPAPGFPKALLAAMQACLVRNPKLRPSVDELLQYQYLGYVGPSPVDPSSGLVDQISAVIHSADSSDNKLTSILTLLTSQK